LPIPGTRWRAPNHDAVESTADFANIAFNKDAFPNRQHSSPATNHSPCRNSRALFA
jgi:hypothetical protein